MTTTTTTLSSLSSSSCYPPQHILDFIASRARRSICSIEECRSAQQQVWIVMLEEVTGSIDDELSNKDNQSHDFLWKDCLFMGRNRLVVRLWKGGCQWWNFNRNSSPHALAEQELHGYRASHDALLRVRVQNATGIVIPRILHSLVSNHAENGDDKRYPWPWAILEYVGPHSLYYLSDDSTRGNSYDYDPKWVERMVKVRHEFGFEEPHPRWGRVPESKALTYAVQVLDQFILPLHLGFNHNHRHHQQPKESTRPASTIGHTYESMVTLYQQTYKKLRKASVGAHNQHQQQDDAIKRQENSQRWDRVLALIQEAVYQILPSNTAEIIALKSPFPSMVLVHLDLQPQNLLLAQPRSNRLDHGKDAEENDEFIVSSVLDWEDAAIADPRFEILLLGRKVCANRDQAEQIWQRYANKICAMMSSSNDKNQEPSLRLFPPETQLLGPLEPWLQLETVHSLLTMLSQSMDGLNGGRNPWESSNDLWGKIEREMTRWQNMLLSATCETMTNGQEEARGKDTMTTQALGIHPAECYRS